MTIIGAVSPPGGDLSEPVTQATQRIVKVFWGLDYALSYARHFPAINWLNSYTLYQTKMDEWMDTHIDPEFSENRQLAMTLLQDEANLQEIVRLVGRDSLSEVDQLKLEAAKSIREDFLQQNAFHDVDTFCSYEKQNKMLKVVMDFYRHGKRALEANVYLSEIEALPVREKIARMKFIPEEEIQQIDEIHQELLDSIEELISVGGVVDAEGV